ncbi:hypothetical protein N2152v2_002863 [Parachlorella kessleri]
MLQQLEVAAAGADAPLRFALSSVVGGSLQHLWIKANTLTRPQLEAIGSIQGLVSLKITYAFELSGRSNDSRVHALHLQHLSGLKALGRLSIDAYFDEPEAGLPVELTALPSLTSLEVMNKAGQRLALSTRLLRGLCRLRCLHLGCARLGLSGEDAQDAWQDLEELLLVDTIVEDAAIAALPWLSHLTALHVIEGILYHKPAVLDSIAACPALKRLALESFEASRLPILAPSQLASLSSLSLVKVDALEHLPASWCLPSLQELTLKVCPSLVRSPDAWPSEMSRMTRLHTLRLEVLQLLELPAPVCGLASLTCLGLVGNQLQTLPEGPYLSNLHRLSLSWNRLPRIPLALALASRLEELDLTSNTGLSLRPTGLQVLQGLSKLKRLNLYALLPSPEEGAVPLPGLSGEEVALALPHVHVELSRYWGY